jgi:hypothetical protein
MEMGLGAPGVKFNFGAEDISSVLVTAFLPKKAQQTTHTA